MGREKRSKFANDAKSTADLASSLAQKVKKGELVIDVKDYGAKGDWNGTSGTDDTLAVNSALNYIVANFPNGASLLFPRGKYKISGWVNLPNVNIEIKGDNAEIYTSIAESGLKQTNHVFTGINGLKFSGLGTGIKFDCPLSVEQHYDFLIENCRFNMAKDSWSIYLKFAREGTIQNCFFENGNGIYRTSTVNTLISKCIFKDGNIGCFDEADVSAEYAPYTCGFLMSDCTMLGMVIGVKLQEGDFFSIRGCMIDYVKNPIQIIGYDGGVISDCSLGQAYGDNPIIDIRSAINNSELSRYIKIHDNMILSYTYADNTVTGISINNASDIKIDKNNLRYYTEYGISYVNSDRIIITNNRLESSGVTAKSIVCTDKLTDDSSNRTILNDLAYAGTTDTQYMQYKDNVGFVTKIKGEVTIPTGTPFVVYTFPTPLNIAPVYSDIKITPITSLNGSTDYYVSYYSKTQMTITLTGTNTADVKFAYEVNVE
jgi:parallel beta-helix repeat protein